MSTSPLIVTPIDQRMQRSVIDEVARYLQLAESLYQQSFEPIDVLFDLKGKVAGMYRVKRKQELDLGLAKRLSSLSSGKAMKEAGDLSLRTIRFNPWIFSKYPEDSWKNTIPHEVAHYVVDSLYCYSCVKPHGKEWQQVMHDFEAQPVVRANYDLSGIPSRQVKRYAYTCECRQVELSSYRHNKICKGIQRYRCRQCGVELQYVSSDVSGT